MKEISQDYKTRLIIKQKLNENKDSNIKNNRINSQYSKPHDCSHVILMHTTTDDIYHIPYSNLKNTLEHPYDLVNEIITNGMTHRFFIHVNINEITTFMKMLIKFLKIYHITEENFTAVSYEHTTILVIRNFYVTSSDQRLNIISNFKKENENENIKISNKQTGQTWYESFPLTNRELFYFRDGQFRKMNHPHKFLISYVTYREKFNLCGWMCPIMEYKVINQKKSDKKCRTSISSILINLNIKYTPKITIGDKEYIYDYYLKVSDIEIIISNDNEIDTSDFHKTIHCLESGYYLLKIADTRDLGVFLYNYIINIKQMKQLTIFGLPKYKEWFKSMESIENKNHFHEEIMKLSKYSFY